MTEPSRRRSRVKTATALGITGVLATTGLALLGGQATVASSHREAPQILGDPQVDNTDVYAFASPDKKNTVTLSASFYPFQEPNGGPNFYPFAEDARYNINVDNDGDGEADIVYRWTFENDDERGDDTFLYNNDVVKSLGDKNLLFKQRYTLEKIEDGDTETLVDDAVAAPSFTGKASMPNYDKLRKQAKQKFEEGRGKAYAGAADDSFFLDLRVFDLLYGGDLSERGQDTLTGYNVNHVAVQVPMDAVALEGDAEDNPVIGVWSTTERLTTKIVETDEVDTDDANGDDNGNGDGNEEDEDSGLLGLGIGPLGQSNLRAEGTTRNVDAVTEWTQVSRLGNPLINEVISAAGMKDEFNRGIPANDANIDGLVNRVLQPEVPKLLKGIYGLKVPRGGKDRTDLVEIFLTGIANDNGLPLELGNLNWHGLNKGVTESELVPSEMLRLNMAVPPTKGSKRSSLGVLGGDLQGFPNGRRYGDDVLDIEVQALAGAVKNKKVKVVKALAAGDKVDENNKNFTRKFPYIAAPNEKGVNRY